MNPNIMRSAVRRTPFQPFTMRLADGRSITIPHPELVAVSNRLVVVINSTDESVTLLEPLLIVSIDTAGPPPSSFHSQANGGPEGPLSPTTQ